VTSKEEKYKHLDGSGIQRRSQVKIYLPISYSV